MNDNVLFEVNADIKDGKNYIYGAGNHAAHMGKWFETHGIPYEGFVYISGNKSVSKDKKVITLDEFKTLDDANLLITQNRWQVAYDELWAELDWRRIYINATWYREETKCIMCDNDIIFSTDAEFAPFLVERIWKGVKKATRAIHCPNCRCYYSAYRPTDAEMAPLYAGYRGEAYFKQRSYFEPEYTAEFNRELGEPSDGGRAKKNMVWNFVKPFIDKGCMKKVLDYGGDKGQFIPDEFADADRYVFEISGNKVLDGITLLNEKDKLTEFKWDLIICSQTLEHLSAPRDCFRELASYMTEKTLLYIDVPIERFMENADFMTFHEHINFFREEVFRIWAKENNLKVVSIATGGIIQVLLSR